MTNEMVRYYAQRAREYDRIYELPQWRDDILTLKALVPTVFTGRRVYEVACGTGYWTQSAAQSAASIYATDINTETLSVARARSCGHVDLGRMTEFLAAFHAHLEPGATGSRSPRTSMVVSSSATVRG